MGGDQRSAGGVAGGMIVAIIQARLGSIRLLRKVARLIAGKTMLARVIERTLQIPEVSEVVVATSDMTADSWIVSESQRCGVRAFQGPHDNVVARYERVARLMDLNSHDLIVRITADCPLLDPVVSSQVIQHHLAHRSDYTANLRDWPDGLDTEVFTRHSLWDAAHLASNSEDREHVTSWMRRNLFCVELPHEPNLRHLKWSVDTEEELQYVQELFVALGPVFSWTKILTLTPAQLCSYCAQGAPHRRYPLGSISQTSLTQPMHTVWDLHEVEIHGGSGFTECLAPEIAKRAAGKSAFRGEPIGSLGSDAAARKNPGVFPSAASSQTDR